MRFLPVHSKELTVFVHILDDSAKRSRKSPWSAWGSSRIQPCDGWADFDARRLFTLRILPFREGRWPFRIACFPEAIREPCRDLRNDPQLAVERGNFMAILSSFSLKPPRDLAARKTGERMSFRLTYQVEGNEVCVESFEPICVLGRAKTCDAIVPVTGVSRNHATIERDENGWILVDSNSTYGTFLNCERITRKRLSHGDKINLGPASRIPVTIRFEVPSLTPSIPPDSIVFNESSANVSLVIRVEDFERDKPALGSAGIIGLFSQVGEALLRSENLDSMLERIAELTLKNLPAQRSVVCLYDEATRQLFPKASRSKNQQNSSDPIVISQSIAKRAIEAKTSVLIDDARQDEQFAVAASIVQQDIRSAMCAPMYHNGSVTGLIYVDTNDFHHRFEACHLEVLTALAVLSAVGVEQERLRRDILQEKAIRDRLARYSSPNVVERIVKDKQWQCDEMLAEEREVSVLFCDLSGFTTLSEHMAPSELAQVLNDLFARLTNAIFRFEGTLDKFMGDAVMAIFGAPLTQPDHAERAVGAAIMMQHALEDFNRSRSNGKNVTMRVGINSGLVVAGDIGSPMRKDYTVLGDTVNVASRLESSVAKPGQIAIGPFTHQLVKHKFQCQPLSPVQLKGKQDFVQPYLVSGPAKNNTRSDRQTWTE